MYKEKIQLVEEQCKTELIVKKIADIGLKNVPIKPAFFKISSFYRELGINMKLKIKIKQW